MDSNPLKTSRVPDKCKFSRKVRAVTRDWISQTKNIKEKETSKPSWVTGLEHIKEGIIKADALSSTAPTSRRMLRGKLFRVAGS